MFAVAEKFADLQLTLIGVDVDRNAIDSCASRLNGNRRTHILVLHAADFFELSANIASKYPGPKRVIMNPPFISYRSLGRRQRMRLAKALPSLRRQMFNLADAFVHECIKQLRPVDLVALLPASVFRRLRAAGQCGDRPQWHPLPSNAFNATIATGWLSWRPSSKSASFMAKAGKVQTAGLEPRVSAHLIRNGVATGADEVYVGLADHPPIEGKVVACARGRDISAQRGLSELRRIWIPPQAGIQDINSALSGKDIRRLKKRYCVSRKGMPLLSYHEGIPSWFLDNPKLLVPEVCVRMSVLSDPRGEILPLHSVLAIQTDDELDLRRTRKSLLRPETWKYLSRICPKMAHGAIRLTVSTLDRALRKFEGL